MFAFITVERSITSTVTPSSVAFMHCHETYSTDDVEMTHSFIIDNKKVIYYE